MKRLKSFAQFIGSVVVIFMVFYGICYAHVSKSSEGGLPLRRLMDDIEGIHRIGYKNTDIVVRSTDLDEVVSHQLIAFDLDTYETLSPSERLYLSPEEQQKLFYARNKHALNYYYYNSAFAKRKIALVLSRTQYSYKWFNYQPYPESLPALKFLLAFQLDGVSNVIYNASYLTNIPKKVLISCNLKYSIIDVIYLFWGGLSALFMLPISFLIGTICHPWETLANLTAGIIFIPPNSISVFSWDYWRLWWDYVCNTNVIASFWDLLYHGIFLPLREFIRCW